MNGPLGPTLPEELLLLALDPQRGTPYCRNRILEYALAGAALAELELQGRVTGQRGEIQVVNPLEPPDPLLAALMRSLPAPGKGRSGVPAQGWVRRAGQPVGGMYLEAAVQRGVLLRETRRFLGLVPYHRHPAGPQSYAVHVRERFAAAGRAGLPDHRSRALASLVAAAGLDRRVPGAGLTSRSAMRSLIHERWPAEAVYRNVRRDASDRSGRRAGRAGTVSSSGS
ncbi:GOLPH3/VPS74 family protein [Streptomyces poriferorum]|uniref:GPP34 family phosphoprotein n=1 Tax=Streptomyces poriferorum TaxID=2798799 RepID=A0ABY9IS37_9ACTN|nr:MULTISPECIES: GPP34 family phosphoprotein [unclassified Streptomyces]MDP5313969.1 GPP34 family phosphoprotein [Streptomyces sp. Alt4]WLQ57089.1 GPP34 family phosphoprotein [Streptomyces sp. Alt2]